MLELILSVGVAVFVSMFCSVAEAALYSLSWSDIEKLMASGRKSAILLHKLRSKVDEPITAILTLNTCAHTAGAAVAGWAWANLYGKDTLWLFTVGFTVIILIFTEILPKTLGVVYNQQIAPPLARPLRGLVLIFRPVIAVMGLLSRMVSKKKTGPDHTEGRHPGHRGADAPFRVDQAVRGAVHPEHPAAGLPGGGGDNDSPHRGLFPARDHDRGRGQGAAADMAAQPDSGL